MHLFTITAAAGVIVRLFGVAHASPLKSSNLQRAVSAISEEEHHYIGNGKRVRTHNTSLPILFNGKPISTTELPVENTDSIHSLSQGHHFYHKDWYLTDKDGGSWDYLSNAKVELVKRIGTPAFSEWVNVSEQFAAATAFSTSIRLFQGTGRSVLALHEFPTLTTWSGVTTIFRYTVEAVDNSGDILAASTSVFGEFANIALNALDFFT
ncbi:hypothetical protein IQ06DRAFT_351540 [Phaeosphaeriaceae sp. SRC1lsM3a]|nr:hypothetical protein IQ06DRAFT_351540 [Stagonospora sp. SRC1lsM3a]